MYVPYPNYNALLLRRTYQDLALPGALMDRADNWLRPTDAHWDGIDHRWEFPSGSTLSFGYLTAEIDKHRYESAEFQFIGIDEVSEMSETQYTFMFSRLRRNKDSNLPLRMRSASNPGGIGNEWVKARFVNPLTRSGTFIQSFFTDNPFIDQVSYGKSLDRLDAVTRAQLKGGNWDANYSSGMFQRQWFPIINEVPAGMRYVRSWDFAATVETGKNDPDYTVGLKMATKDGRYYITDVKRVRLSPLGVEQLVAQTAILDGRGTSIWIEMEGGSSGVDVADHYQRHVLNGFNAHFERATGSKIERAKPFSSAAEAGNVLLLFNSRWNEAYLDELSLFPVVPHDDQTDASSQAHKILSVAVYGFQNL